MRNFNSVFLALFIASLQACSHGSPKPEATAAPVAGFATNTGTEDQLKSAIRSSVEGFNITNVHFVAKDQGSLYRGMRPVLDSDAKDLVEKIKVTDVLVFRAPSKEIAFGDEVKMFAKVGVSKEHVFNIPFRWKDISSFKEGCLQSIEALKLFKKTLKTKNSVLFTHCTVGEDRTGYIFGLYRILFEQKPVDSVFHDEMCERGFAEGNPRKPKDVVELVHKNVTALFLKMNYYIAKGDLTVKNLSPKICDKDPLVLSKELNASFDEQLGKHRCQTSSGAL